MKKTYFEIAKELVNSAENEKELLEACRIIPIILAKPSRPSGRKRKTTPMAPKLALVT